MREFVTPARGRRVFAICSTFSRLGVQRGRDELHAGTGRTPFAIRARTLIVLFTDFVDTVTAELLIENVQRLTGRHLVVFVALRDPVLTGIFATLPATLPGVARAILAYDSERDRSLVLERLQRLGVHCWTCRRHASPSRCSAATWPIKQRDSPGALLRRGGRVRERALPQGARAELGRIPEILVEQVRTGGLVLLTPDQVDFCSPSYIRSALSSLSVARAIALDPALIDYLDDLALRAYLAFGPPPRPPHRARSFPVRGFPQAVRALRGHVAVASSRSRSASPPASCW